MSEKIREIIDVLETVREDIELCESKNIKKIRIVATDKVATKRGISIQSVQDKYTRKINLKTDEFDQLIDDWLFKNSIKLKELLIENTDEIEDIEAIVDYFENRAKTTDRLVAFEFGYNETNAQYKEGKLKLFTHIGKERKQQLIKQAKEYWLKRENGNIKCVVCEFSFNDTYPTVSNNYIEAHHIKPISELETDTVVTIEELVPVCANCHRMLHHSRPWITVEELKETIRR